MSSKYLTKFVDGYCIIYEIVSKLAEKKCRSTYDSNETYFTPQSILHINEGFLEISVDPGCKLCRCEAV
jgi:hypothetical protein